VAIRALRGIFHSDTIPLGFGCGGLMGKSGRSESLRLLEAAIDCGIKYFDTARMYGFGDAEGVLGKLMPRHRDRVILASKAGILPPNRSVLRRLTSRGVRLLQDAVPTLKGFVQAPEVWQPRFGVFELAELGRSLETSLRELRTDHLDIFLLHECTAADVGDPELLEFLQSLKQQGKIREYGVATGIEETVRIIESHPLLTPIVQIPNSIWDMNIIHLPSRPDGLTITHSFLVRRLRPLLAELSSDDSLAREWYSRIQVDPLNGSTVAQLLLAHALRSNPDGIVLFSSLSPANIRANVQLATNMEISLAQVDALSAFAKERNWW
jgi:D-threo-aldose 1-dehydrogenase